MHQDGLAAPTLRTRDLTVTRRGRALLDGVSLELEQGVTALLGPNGAGKTTLMNVLATALQPSSGEVAYPGQTEPHGSSLNAVRRQLGWLPQRFSLVPSLTVEETVRYAAWCNGVEAEHARVAAQNALAQVSISDLADRRVRTLSGGQRQRLGLATAVAHSPAVLLLDEPTAGLDPAQRQSFKRFIHGYGKVALVVYATHIFGDVDGISDAYVVLQNGQIAFSGTPQQLIAKSPPSGPSSLEQGYSSIVGEDNA